MKRRGILGIAFLAAIMLFLSYPSEVTVAPPWTVEVKDGEGKPFQGVCVVEWWQHYSVEKETHEEGKLTDVRGRVEFPLRARKASIFDRVFGALRNIAETGVHASFGPFSYVHAYKLGFGTMGYRDSQNTSWSGWSSNMHSTFVLRRCPEGFSEDGCILEIKYMIAPGAKEPIDPCKPNPLD